MFSVCPLKQIRVDDYLISEIDSPYRREYLNGAVYRVADERNAHNDLSVNLLGSLHRNCNRQRFRPWTSSVKVRVRMRDQTRFYYPDLTVTRRSNPLEDSFQDEPVVLFEVLSCKTRRIDEGEKKDAYLTIPTLNVYALIEQDAPAIVAYRRTDAGFVREIYEGLEAVLPLGEIKTELRLADIYEGLEFVPEIDEDEER